MPSKADWLTMLPGLAPGGTLIIYPAAGLTPADAHAAMVAMGYNMRHYHIGTHGNSVHVRRWSEVISKPQNPQPEFKPNGS